MLVKEGSPDGAGFQEKRLDFGFRLNDPIRATIRY